MSLSLTCTRERIGFRSHHLTLVCYPRRGYVEAWLFQLGALRLPGRKAKWVFTRHGQFILAGGMTQNS